MCNRVDKSEKERCHGAVGGAHVGRIHRCRSGRVSAHSVLMLGSLFVGRRTPDIFQLVVAGIALVVYVLRALLARAVTLDSRAKYLQSELDEVI